MESIILPGEACQVETGTQFGPDFLQVDENIGFSTAAGRLEIVTNKKESKKLVIRHVKSIYFPKENDTIIGIIVKRNAENYGVDINGSQPAVLDSVEFNGATKRNKPNLKVGDLIYAKVASVNKFTAPVLTCKSKTCKKDWTSGESTFGELKNGICLTLCAGVAEALRADRFVFDALQQHVGFEVALGYNSRMYIHTDNAKNLVLLSEFFKGVLPLNDQGEMARRVKEVSSLFVKA